MAEKKVKKPLMQQDTDVEFGYWDKRKDEFNKELQQGFGENKLPPKPKVPRKRGDE